MSPYVLAACRQSLAHGALLATRYMLAEMDFTSPDKAAEQELKVRLQRISHTVSGTGVTNDCSL
jgi:hypothetical protein